MQAPLQAPHPEIRFGKPFLASRRCTYTRSCPIRPGACISYEHVFPSSRTSRLAQRALGALRLTRSFLLLEDDYDVDWEVDPNGHSQAPHPHRVALRASLPARRPGTPAPANHVCLCPVRAPGTATRTHPASTASRGRTPACL
jgi:hypothetical protein